MKLNLIIQMLTIKMEATNKDEMKCRPHNTMSTIKEFKIKTSKKFCNRMMKEQPSNHHCLQCRTNRFLLPVRVQTNLENCQMKVITKKL